MVENIVIENQVSHDTKNKVYCMLWFAAKLRKTSRCGMIIVVIRYMNE